MTGTNDDLPEIPAMDFPKTWDWIRECGVALQKWEMEKVIDLAQEEMNISDNSDDAIKQCTEALDHIYNLFENSHEMTRRELHERIGMMRNHIEFSIANLKSFA